jgi:hypothetical protein
MGVTIDKNRTGYLHPQYAESLSFLGSPRFLPNSGGWIVERRIPGTKELDGIGIYPFFVCDDWSGLKKDLETARDFDVVSLVLVTDPFGSADPALLRECFDLVVPFKEHFVASLIGSPEGHISSHHRRKVLSALKRVEVERAEDPVRLSGDWVRLYRNLIIRHNIKGMSAFPDSSLIQQLHVPGATLFRAKVGETTVAMSLWYTQNAVAYYHLGASDGEGYRLSASYAVFWLALRHFFETGARWASLGAAAGTVNETDNGLSFFKRGWANETRPVHLCGKVLDTPRYQELVAERGAPASAYFPAYRFPGGT